MPSAGEHAHRGTCPFLPVGSVLRLAPLLGSNSWELGGELCLSTTRSFALQRPESKILGRGKTASLPVSGHSSDQSPAAVKGIIIEILNSLGALSLLEMTSAMWLALH